MCVEQKVSCSCTCPPKFIWAKRSHGFGFPKSCARTISCAKRAPRLAQVYGIVSERPGAWHKSYDMCRAGTNSDTFRTECASQGGGFAQVFRARARFGETQNYGVALLKWIWWAGAAAAYFLFHTHQSVETRNSSGTALRKLVFVLGENGTNRQF